jgi:A/G-specific adenine glycosylase
LNPPRDTATLPDAQWLAAFRRRLRTWYSRHARDLPWRRRRDPYAIWVSEIMLQQTQVATVEAYFARFLAAFPTIADLAAADQQQVMRQWEGLGYYRRAAQMHAAARRIAAEHGGTFPREFQAVRQLPGIGRYTAGAILSIAFDARQPILEANTVRLFSRLLAYGGDPTSAAGQKLLWALAEAVLPTRDVGRFNQALMELGSQQCTPRAPRCEACPVATLCRAGREGLTDQIPRPKRKPVVERLHEAALVVRRDQHVLLLRRPEGVRWAGLWDFPRFSLTSDDPHQQREELQAALRRSTGVVARIDRHLATLRHTVTRFRITLDCYQATPLKKPDAEDLKLPSPACGRGAGGEGIALLRWVRPAELADYPLSTTGRKLARLIHVSGNTGGHEADRSP